MKTKFEQEKYESPTTQTLGVRTEGILCGSDMTLYSPQTIHESFMGDGTYEW